LSDFGKTIIWPFQSTVFWFWNDFLNLDCCNCDHNNFCYDVWFF